MNNKIAILGRGRMGQAIQNCIAESDDLQVAGIWVRDGSTVDAGTAYVCSANLESVLAPADVAIDFTLPAVNEQVVTAAVAAQTPLVCGVSGLTAANRQHLAEAAAEIPILYDRNMSLGVAVLQQLTRLAGSALGDQFAAEIHETHHVHKIDAPSGTALLIGEALAASRGQTLAEVYHYDTDNAQQKGDIHFEVARRGEVPGEHTLLFESAHESLALVHKVTDRRVFAVGALRAARWLVNRAPALYSMQDIVMENR